ncbi:universal stress protein [Luteipulveratus halotolerans]|uniref:UspA domain-containing protein n=1 Tax=Luteipulveratus halotolerans TaxID=1631356 RepID=A0A0L6CGP8_9MICO|nr:universal stress protein [Luteipulveratus halotolerans]KNX36904.1 hypothetical protein VV01_06670 [Luteipulveratus halotolerans]
MEGIVHPGSIVVGIDSSSESLAALDWATEHARRYSAPLHLITAYSPVNRPGVSGHFVLCLYPDGMRRFRAA